VSPNKPGVDYSPIGVFDKYANEATLKASTIKRWRPVIAKVQAEVPDIRDLTPEWCLAWKNTLVETDLARRTIRDIYLAALKALCNYAAENLMIETNPVEKIKVRGKDKARLRTSKGYTYEEAKVVLSASLEEQNPKLPIDRRASRRWCPWVAYYGGARIGEITQLRKPDVFKKEGVWVMKISPEAGGVKTDQVRLVAIHPHLIEMGFIDFVQECSTETLFYDPARSRGGKEGNPTSKKTGERLARWVRELGIVDKELQPNHGWRHRFKTLARRAEMRHDVCDYMQGHAHGNQGAYYGDYPAPVLYHEICKIPYFSFDRPDVTLADLEIDAAEEAAKDAKRAA
jgi:integrase